MAIRKKFRGELKDIDSKICEMGDLAVDSIKQAFLALKELDLEPIAKVKENDKKLYGLSIEIEKMCTRLIALQAPVAGDLRFTTSALKITTDLDRIGRYGLDIAKHVEAMMGDNENHFKKLVGLERLTELASRMVFISVSSFINRDIDSTKEVFEIEEEVDALYDEIFREVLTYMVEDMSKISLGTRYVLIGRYLERVADHACNISERTVYVVTGMRRSVGACN